MVNLIKSTLQTLRKNNIPATPKNYAKEFYLQSIEKEIPITELEEMGRLINNFCVQEKKAISKNKVTTYYDISQVLNQRMKNIDVGRFLVHLKTLMKPSISQKVTKKIDSLIEDISLNPYEIMNDSVIKKLEEITEDRITNDREGIREKASDIKKMTELMGKYFDKSLIQSNDTTDELSHIKEEIDELELSEQSLRAVSQLQSKLVDTVFKLENSMEKNRINLIKGKDECLTLESEIEKLQADLEKVQKEKNIDFLTGVMNRRGFTEAMSKIENEYKVFDSKYAIIFFDIDFFKDVNDKYGHDCGDSVLATFANIIGSLTRANDVVSRYGGEEFVSLIHYRDIKEVENYASRVKAIIAKSKFKYKDLKLKIQFSAGVSFRCRYDSFDETLKKADDLLYEAKHNGRDKIIFDDENEL